MAQNRCELSIPYERPCIIEVQRAQRQCPTRSWRHGRGSKQDRPSKRPKRPRKHAAQHVLVTRKDTTNVLATSTPPRSAHQRRGPLTASARCARSPPPWLGFGHRWHTSSSRRGLSGSAFRRLPATRRAACEACVTGSMRERRRIRDRVFHGCEPRFLQLMVCEVRDWWVRTALPKVELSESWTSRSRAAFARSIFGVGRIVVMLVTRCRSRTSADLRPAARRAPADGGRTTTRTRQRTGRRLSGTRVCRSGGMPTRVLHGHVARFPSHATLSCMGGK